MNTTVRIKQSEVYKDWHVIDAAGRPLGRVATEVAAILKGKHKPTYEPHLDDGDFVIVVNASQVRLSGNKSSQKVYYRHSGYPGGLKQRTFDQAMEKFPERVLEQAIWGMLPKGPLGKQMFRHLKVYKFANHPHQSQLAGSAKAQEARKESQAELATIVPKVKRLRPLSVPQVRDEEEAPVAKAKAPTPAATAARKARARVRGTEAAKPAAAEDEKVKAPAAKAPAIEAPDTEAEAPKRAPRRKAADTDGAAEATKAEAPAEDKPKRAPRKKADAEATADAGAEATTEEKKPARRRAAAKSEGTEE